MREMSGTGTAGEVEKQKKFSIVNEGFANPGGGAIINCILGRVDMLSLMRLLVYQVPTIT